MSRPKYVAAAELVLGAALRATDRPDDAVAPLESALRWARGVPHPPTVWRAAAELGRAHYAAGRDDAAEQAHALARGAVEGFASALSDVHRARLLDAESTRGIVG